MITTYRVIRADGRARELTTLGAVKELMVDSAWAQAEVKPVVRYTPCDKHRAYEATNCPRCQQDVASPSN